MTPDEMELAEPTDDPEWSGYVALLRRARAAHVRWHGDDEPHEVMEFCLERSCIAFSWLFFGENGEMGKDPAA